MDYTAKTRNLRTLHQAIRDNDFEKISDLLIVLGPNLDNIHTLEVAIKHGNLNTIKQLMAASEFTKNVVGLMTTCVYSKRVDILQEFLPFSNSEKNAIVLKRAAQIRDIEIVQCLVPLVGSEDNTEALVAAARRGYEDIVKELIPINSQKAHSKAFAKAVEFGHTACVQLLLPLAHPAIYDEAFRISIAKKYVDCAAFLLPHTTGLYNDLSLRSAAMQQDYDLVALLLPHSNYQTILNALNVFSNGQTFDFLKSCVDEYEVAQQKERLIEHMKDIEGVPSQKRKL